MVMRGILQFEGCEEVALRPKHDCFGNLLVALP